MNPTGQGCGYPPFVGDLLLEYYPGGCCSGCNAHSPTKNNTELITTQTVMGKNILGGKRDLECEEWKDFHGL
jgi:hypothetical protein